MWKQRLSVMISSAIVSVTKNMAKKAKQAALEDIFKSERKVILQRRVISVDEEGYFGSTPTPDIKDRVLCTK